MSGERRDDTGANLPIYGCDEFSRPTTSYASRHTANHRQASTAMIVAHISAMAALMAPWMQALVTHRAASSWLARQRR
jgi:hypothetical protein